MEMGKTVISCFEINLRYVRLNLLKNKEDNNKICHIFYNFKNSPCYVMSEVSLKRFYFALFDDGLTLKTLKLAFICFAFKLFIYTTCPRKETRFTSEISSLLRKSNYMLHYQGYFLFFHLIPNTR